MATLYRTPWGTSWEPMTVDMWTWAGEPLGAVAGARKTSASWSTREADLLEVTAPLTPENASLLDVEGGVVLSVTLGGLTMLAQPAKVGLEALDDDPKVGVIRAVASGGRSLLEGQIIVSDPGLPLSAQTEEEITISGPVESVVKQILQWGAAATGHPIVVMPDQQRGPYVSVTGAMSTAAELVEDALAGTGWWLDMPGWVPGLPQPEGMALTAPTYLAELRPYRDRPGLVWSVTAGDLDRWEIESSRATGTRAIVGEDLDDGFRYLEVAGIESSSPWHRRDVYVSASGGEDLEAAGRAELAKRTATASASVPLTPGAQWRLGDDHGPGAYRHGDRVIIDVPVLGQINQVVTEVTATVDEERFSITPSVGPADTVSHDIYKQMAQVGRRIARLERER